ncbi:uncharacterized protein LOC107616385 [Arachis ipaensis]|uniref:uncharacterized protein LOC107616385 n=1 Tax=Arachis ipaensis TaxID=130454 RepID=UPI0007AF36D0|nr:uncharacterized protein LOC107616385 [Arachis ipaensis]XP_025679060.1 uncharacterized protein LOC112779011 [Arachis hypogaea]
MDLYNRITDPRHHLNNFKSQMYLADASDATHCKALPTTLTKSVMKWLDNLPPRSVTGFDDLARKFLTRFSIQKNKVKHAPSLLEVKQEVRAKLRDYMERFNKACLEIQNLPTETVIMGLVNCLKKDRSLNPYPSETRLPCTKYKNGQKKYVNMEVNSQLSEPLSRFGLPYRPRKKEKEAKKKEEYNSEKPRRYHNYTSLRVSLVDVYREICHTEKLPPPRPIKHKKTRSRVEYSEYHKLYGHSTNDCYYLKNVIEKLAREG